MLGVLFLLASALALLSASLLGPIFVGLIANEIDVAGRITIYLAMGSFFAVSVLFAIFGRQGQPSLIGGFLLTVLIWILAPLFLALPLYDTSGLSFIDATFEAVSGLTSTGASVIGNLDALPRATIFLRSQIQWVGGYFTLLTILLVLSPAGIGGLPNISNLSISRRSLEEGEIRLFDFAFNIARYYLFATGLCFLLLTMTGTRPFFAAQLAMTAVSTGGFLPFDADLQTFVGPLSQLILAVFLIVAATSIVWQRAIVKNRWSAVQAHRESYIILGVVVLLGLVLAAVLFQVSGSASGVSPGQAFAEGIFNAASLVSTSGIETREGVFSLLPYTLILMVVLAGGSAFSTAGGLKYYRFGALMVQSSRELNRLVYPRAIQSAKFGSQNYNIDLLKAIWSFMVVAIFTIALGTFALAVLGLRFEAALMAAVSSFSNAGPVYSSGWAPQGDPNWPAYADFSSGGKITLMVLMILGRLEVLVVLAAFNLKYWTNR